MALYLLVIIVGLALFYSIESPVNPNVASPNDALWFMIVTITSVGYGDIVPYIGLGRIIGGIAMISAILFASLVKAITTSALLEKFRAERAEITKASTETIGNVIAQLSAAEQRLEQKFPALEDSTDDIKADLTELKAMRAEIQRSKELIEEKRERNRFFAAFAAELRGHC